MTKPFWHGRRVEHNLQDNLCAFDEMESDMHDLITARTPEERGGLLRNVLRLLRLSRTREQDSLRVIREARNGEYVDD